MAKSRYGGYNPATQTGGFEEYSNANPQVFANYSGALKAANDQLAAQRAVVNSANLKKSLDNSYQPTNEELQAQQEVQSYDNNVRLLEKQKVVAKDTEHNDTIWGAISSTPGLLIENFKNSTKIGTRGDKESLGDFATRFVKTGLVNMLDPTKLLTSFFTNNTDRYEGAVTSSKFVQNGARVVNNGDDTYSLVAKGKTTKVSKEVYDAYQKELKTLGSLEKAAIQERLDRSSQSWLAQAQESKNSVTGLTLDMISAGLGLMANIVKSPATMWSTNWAMARANEFSNTMEQLDLIYANITGDGTIAARAKDRIADRATKAEKYDKAWKAEVGDMTEEQYAKSLEQSLKSTFGDTLGGAAATTLQGVGDVTRFLSGLAAKEADKLDNTGDIRTMISSQVNDTNGTVTSLTEGTAPAEISKKTMDINGTKVPVERDGGASGSVWDIEKIALDDNGKPVMDSEGNPVYISKYSFWDKVKNSNWSALAEMAYVRENIYGEAVEELLEIPLTMGVGKVVSWGAKGVNALSKVAKLGSIAGKGFEHGTTAFLESLRESGQIARGAKNEVMDQLIDNKMKSSTIQEIATRIQSENPNISDSMAFVMAKKEKDAEREQWLNDNPEELSSILTRGEMAFTTALQVNSLSAFSDVSGVKMINGRKKLFDNILSKPLGVKSLAKGTYQLTRESLKEGILEEAIFNTVSERAGIAHGLGKYYDYAKDVTSWDSEQFDSFAAGAFAGGAMGGFANAKNLPTQLKQYKQQQKLLREIDTSNPAMKELLVTRMKESANALVQQQAQQEIASAMMKGNYAEAKRIESDNLNAQIIKHTKAGTLGEFSKRIDGLMSDPDVDPTTIEQTQRRVALIGAAYDKYADVPGADVDAILANLGARATTLDQIEFVQKYKNNALTQMKAEGDRTITEENKFIRLQEGQSNVDFLENIHKIEDSLNDTLKVLEKRNKDLTQRNSNARATTLSERMIGLASIRNAKSLLDLENTVAQQPTALQEALQVEVAARKRRLQEQAVAEEVKEKGLEVKPEKPATKPTIKTKKERLAESVETEKQVNQILEEAEVVDGVDPASYQEEVDEEEESADTAAFFSAEPKVETKESTKGTPDATPETLEELEAQRDALKASLKAESNPDSMKAMVVEVQAVEAKIRAVKKNLANADASEATKPAEAKEKTISTPTPKKETDLEVADREERITNQMTEFYERLVADFEKEGPVLNLLDSIALWDSMKYTFGAQNKEQVSKVFEIISEIESEHDIKYVPLNIGKSANHVVAELDSDTLLVVDSKSDTPTMMEKGPYKGKPIILITDSSGYAYRDLDGVLHTSEHFTVTVVYSAGKEDFDALKVKRVSSKPKKVPAKKEVVKDIGPKAEVKKTVKSKVKEAREVDTTLEPKKTQGYNKKATPFRFKKDGKAVYDTKVLSSIMYAIDEAMVKYNDPDKVLALIEKHNPISSAAGKKQMKAYLEAYYDYTIPMVYNNKSIFTDWYNGYEFDEERYQKKIEAIEEKGGYGVKRADAYRAALVAVEEARMFIDGVNDGKKESLTSYSKAKPEVKEAKTAEKEVNPAYTDISFKKGEGVYSVDGKQYVVTDESIIDKSTGRRAFTKPEEADARNLFLANYALHLGEATEVFRESTSKSNPGATLKYIYLKNGTIVSSTTGKFVFTQESEAREALAAQANTAFNEVILDGEPKVVTTPKVTQQSMEQVQMTPEDIGYKIGAVITEDMLDKSSPGIYQKYIDEVNQGEDLVAFDAKNDSSGKAATVRKKQATVYFTNQVIRLGRMYIAIGINDSGVIYKAPIIPKNLPKDNSVSTKDELSDAPKARPKASTFGLSKGTRRKLNTSKMSPERLESFKRSVMAEQAKLDKPDKPATFWEYLTYKVETEGRETTFEKFSAYELGWQLTGRPVSYEDGNLDIHDIFFASLASVESFIDDFIEFEEEIPTGVTELPAVVSQKIREEQKPPVQKPAEPTTVVATASDETVEDVDFVEEFTSKEVTPEQELTEFEYQTDTAVLKSAGLGVQSIDGQDYDINTPEKAYLRDGNNNWWNPEIAQEGATIILRPIPHEEAVDLLVTQYVENEDGTYSKEEAVRFGDLFPDYDPENPEYVAKVPMKYTSEDGLEINWIHDLDWYNNQNVASVENQAEIIASAKKQLFQLRKKAISNPEGIKGKISKRRLGGFTNVVNVPSDPRTEDSTHVAVSKMSPTSIMAMATDSNTLFVQGAAFEGEILNANSYAVGQIYEIREITVNADGSKTYMAFPTLGNDPKVGEELPTEVFDTIRMSIGAVIWKRMGFDADTSESSLKGTPKQIFKSLTNIGLDNDFVEDIIDNVRDSMGYDLLSTSNSKGPGDTGIGAFLDLFIHVGTDEESFYNVFSDSQTYTKNDREYQKHPDGVTHVYLDGKGRLTIAKKNSKKPAKKDNKVASTFAFGAGAVEGQLSYAANILLEGDGSRSPLRDMRLNFSKHKLGTNQSVLHIDPTEGTILPYGEGDGNFEIKNSYDKLVKDNRRTDVYARRVPDRRTPNKVHYVTDLQPVIELDFGNEVVPVTEEENRLYDEVKNIVVSGEDKGVLPEPVEPKLPKEVEDFYDGVSEEIGELPDELRDKILGLSIKGIEADIEQYQRPYKGTRRRLSNILKQGIRAIGIPGVDGLTRAQYKMVIKDLNQYVFDILSKKEKVTTVEISETLLRAIPDTIGVELYNTQKLMKELDKYGGAEKHPKLHSILSVKEEKLQTIIDNQHAFISFTDNDAPVSKQVMSKLKVKDLEYDQDLDDGVVEHLHNQESGLKDVRKSFSSELEILFSGIKKADANNNVDKSFAGISEYHDASTIIGVIRSELVRIPSSWDALIKALSDKSDKPIINSILLKLQDPDMTEKTKNALLYNLIQNKFEMRALTFENKDPSGLNLHFGILNPNSTSANIMYEQAWKTNFFTSEIFDSTNKDTFNKKEIDARIKHLEKLLSDLKSAKLKRGAIVPEKFFEDIRKAMEGVGIDVDNTVFIQYLIKEGSNIQDSKGLLNQALFTYKKMSVAAGSGKEYNPKAPEFNMFRSISSSVKKIIAIRTELDGNPLAKSIRVANNTYQGTVQPMLAYQAVSELKDPESENFKALSKIPYTANNFLLGLLGNSSSIRTAFDAIFLGPEALAELNTDNKSGKVQSLSPSDRATLEVNMFTKSVMSVIPDMEKLTTLFTRGVAVRMAYMFNSALSDKANQIAYSTVLLDLQSTHFKPVTKDVPGTKLKGVNMLSLVDGVASGDPLQLLVEQIFGSELDRIFSVIEQQPGINGYDEAGRYFVGTPLFNEMKIDLDSFRGTLAECIDYYISMEGESKAECKVLLYEAAYRAAGPALAKIIDSEVWKKIGVDKNTGFEGSWVKAGIIRDNGLALDQEYLNRKWAGMDEGAMAMYTAYDFVINNLLHQANQAQLLSGDSAFYSPAKDGKYKNKDGSVNFLKLAKATGESLTKRMAQMIAPGSVLANAKGERYLQIMVNDRESIATTLPQLIVQMYGSEALTPELEKVIEEYYKAEREVEFIYTNKEYSEEERLTKLEVQTNIMGVNVKVLKGAFPSLSAYMGIEGTDAQEYTTWQEHFDVVFRQGRLDAKDLELLKEAYAKLQENPDYKLNPNELHAVFTNPIKPVHAGREIQYYKNSDGTYDYDRPMAMRPMYIKSSSFPLLPQLTQGTRLEGVRQKMEILANDNGKYLKKENGFRSSDKPYRGVRLSYQTANKVGGSKTKLTMDDLYYLPLDEIISKGGSGGLLGQSLVELNRENFRIQLDVPDKMTKHVKSGEEDAIIMGSQIWKMVMGSGINKITRSIFPNRFNAKVTEKLLPAVNKLSTMTGLQLDSLKTEIERQYGNTQLALLRSELGLDSDGNVSDMSFTLQAIKDILKTELETKEYPEYIVNGLDLVKTPEAELEFLLPLWMSPSTNKFESMLQAMIANRLIKYKLPGLQHVSASAEGFERTKVGAFEDLPAGIKSAIVYIDGYDGSTLKSSYFEDGRLKYSQVLLKSHFRVPKLKYDESGKVIGESKEMELIDLTQEPYSRFDSVRGTYILREEALPTNLREMFSFRIPTSAHQSGAMLEVVGFLPPGSGDTIVVPKEHTVQIGEDFDVDKRSLYKKHYTVDKTTGYIREYEAPEGFDLLEDFSEVDSALYYKTNDYLTATSTQLNAYRDSYKDVVRLFEKHRQLAELEQEGATTEDTAVVYREYVALKEAIQKTYPTEDFESLEEDLAITLEQYTTALEDFKMDGATVNEDGSVEPNSIYKNYYAFRKMKRHSEISKKLLENAMVATYESVYTAEDIEVQNKIMKVLSMDIAEDSAKDIDGRRNGDTNQTYFTILSDEYQAQQVSLGASGKTGISMHSNAVVNHARYERLEQKVVDAMRFAFGEFDASDGQLGRTRTLDTRYNAKGEVIDGRDVADVGAENQNSATDNVKAQIMGKRNENDYTMAAYIHLFKHGFDRNTVVLDSEGNPVNYIEGASGGRVKMADLLISQPIMWDYVELMQNSQGVISEFNPNPKKSAVRKLVEYYGATDLVDMAALERGDYTEMLKLDVKPGQSYDDAFYEYTKGVNGSSPLTPQKMWDNIDPSTTTPETQVTALVQFLRAESRGKALTKFEGATSLNTSGLDKSYFTVIDKLKTVRAMYNNKDFPNIGNTVGEFTMTPPIGDKSYIDLGEGIYVKPTTTEGIVAINALVQADRLMGAVYPYKKESIASILEKAVATATGFKQTELSKTAKDEVQYAVMEALREYYYSSPNSGLFEGDISEERRRIFDNNQAGSLFNIIKNLRRSGHPIMLENALLKDLTYTRDTKSPHRDYTLTVSTEAGDMEDKSRKYDAFTELLHDDTTELAKLPGGEIITPQKLALDLANYAYLSKDRSGFTGLRELINPELLSILGFTDFTRNISRDLEIDEDEFLEQFYQHYPEHAAKFSSVSHKEEQFEEFHSSQRVAQKVRKGSSIKPDKNGQVSVADLLSLNTLARESDPDNLSYLKKAYKAVETFTLADKSNTPMYMFFKAKDEAERLFKHVGDGVYTVIQTVPSRALNFYDTTGPIDPDNYFAIKNASDTELHSLEIVGAEGTYNSLVEKDSPKRKEYVSVMSSLSKTKLQGGTFSLVGVLPALKKLAVRPGTGRQLEAMLSNLEQAMEDHGSGYPKDGILEVVKPKDSTTPLARFEPSTGKIIMRSDIFEVMPLEENETRADVMMEILLEEIMHAYNNVYFSAYIKENPITGQLEVDTAAPQVLHEIAAMYQTVRELDLRDEDGNVMYEVQDIDEFVANVIASKSFRDAIDAKIPSFSSRFIDAVLRLLGLVEPDGPTASKELVVAIDNWIKEGITKRVPIKPTGKTKAYNYTAPVQKVNQKVNKVFTAKEETGDFTHPVLSSISASIGKKVLHKGGTLTFPIEDDLTSSHLEALKIINGMLRGETGQSDWDMAEVVVYEDKTTITLKPEYRRGEKKTPQGGAVDADIMSLLYAKDFLNPNDKEESHPDPIGYTPPVAPKSQESSKAVLGSNQGSNQGSKSVEKSINVYAGTNSNSQFSNFATRPFKAANGVIYKNVESAFHHHKLEYAAPMTQQPSAVQSADWSNLSGAEARALGRSIVGLDVASWDADSKGILHNLMFDSFYDNLEAAQELVATYPAELTHKNAQGIEQDNGRFSELLTTVREMLMEEGVSKPQNKDTNLNPTNVPEETRRERYEDFVETFGKPKSYTQDGNNFEIVTEKGKVSINPNIGSISSDILGVPGDIKEFIGGLFWIEQEKMDKVILGKNSTQSKTPEITTEEWNNYYGIKDGALQNSKGEYAGTLAPKFFNPLFAAFEALKVSVLNSSNVFIKVKEAEHTLMNKYGFTKEQINLLDRLEGHSLAQKLDGPIKFASGMENSDAEIHANNKTFVESFEDPTAFLLKVAPQIRKETPKPKIPYNVNDNPTYFGDDDGYVPPPARGTRRRIKLAFRLPEIKNC